MKTRKWWLIPIVLLALMLVFAGIFRHTLMVYIAPKTVLTAALTDAVDELQIRFSSGPLPVLLEGVDPEGKNTLDLQLVKASPLLGDVGYDMQVQMEQNPRRILARGQVQFQQKNMDVSVYLDGTFAALSSAELLQGRYYGLTYDSFAQDIGENAILRLLIDRQTLQQWQESVLGLQSFMNEKLEPIDVSRVDIRKLIPGIMALKADVDTEELVLNENVLRCYKISFETTGYEVLQGIRYLQAELPISIDPSAEISVSFWIHDGAVLQMELETDSAADETEIMLQLGEVPSTDDLLFRIRNSQGYRVITLAAEREGSVYREVISVDQVQNTIKESFAVDYRWDPERGDLQISAELPGRQAYCAVTLQPAENGFLLKTRDFESLMHLLTGAKDNGDSECTVAVTKGANVTTPEYKNFDQWSMEDLLTLIGGLGGLFGLQIQ